MTVLVLEASVPFVQGGAEYHVRELVRHLRGHGHDAELISVPFKWYPQEELLSHAAAWRLLDLSEANGRPIDLVIATKFPTYFARHPRKVLWLIHQYRAAYELAGTPYSHFRHTDDDAALRDEIVRLDTAMIGECVRRFANSANTAARLQRYNGLDARPLYHPPRLADRLRGGPAESFVLSVGRLETVKRVDLAIRAMAELPPHLSLVIVGHGTQRPALTALVESLGLGDRVTFAGEVDDDTLVDLYARTLGVIFPPYDEDFGYVTLEAFLAHKPVITTTDAGGPNEFVVDGVNGRVTPPDAAAIAEAIAALDGDRRRAAAMGDAGFERARTVTWAGVVEQLTGA